MVYDDLDLSNAVRTALFSGFKSRFSIMAENVSFKDPEDGSAWLKFDYFPVEKIYRSIDRKCIRIRAMVQIGIVFAPDNGMTEARTIAKEIANFFKDGKILDVGFVFEGASSRPVQKSERGWLLPVRFTVQYDEKEI